MLLPELATQVEDAEQAQAATVLAVSTLYFHTDRREPKPILARSWKLAEGKHKCQYARPAVIELGEQQGRFLQVCIEKKKCTKHWPQQQTGVSSGARRADVERRHAEGGATPEPLDIGSVQPGDIVGVGIHIGNALRGYEIGTQARERGATVVFGGIHATLDPDEAHHLGAAHAVVKGDGDVVWPLVLNDATHGALKLIYEAGRVDAERFVAARWELLPHGRYMWGSVQTVRGCPKHCSFCSAWRTDGQKPRQRRVTATLTPSPGNVEFAWEKRPGPDAAHVGGVPITRHWLIPQHNEMGRCSAST